MEFAREWYREQKTKEGCKWIRQISENRVHWWLINVMTQMQTLVQSSTTLSPARSSEVKPGEGSLTSWSLSDHLLWDQTFVLTLYDYICRVLFTNAPCWTDLWLQQWSVRLRELRQATMKNKCIFSAFKFMIWGSKAENCVGADTHIEDGYKFSPYCRLIHPTSVKNSIKPQIKSQK